MARSKTKFTQSGPGKTFFFPPPFPDAEHVRHLRLQHTICAAEDCGWASSLGQSKNTHRCKRIFIICGEILVADKQKPLCLWNLVTRRFFFFYSWLLGYCGPSLRMTNSDIRSTKRYILLQNRYAFRSKQSHEFINRII